MTRLPATLAVLCFSAALAMVFAWAFCWWWELSGSAMNEVLLIYATATIVVLVLFFAGKLFLISSHAFYIVLGAAVFLAVDLLVWQRTGIMPHVKFSRSGFMPAAIMGLVVGVLFRVVAVSTPVLPRDPRA